MGGKGSKTNTTTSTSSAPADVQANYKQLTGMASNAAQIPFTPYTGQMVAPFNSAEQSALAAVPGAANAYQPYYGQAQGLIGQGTQQFSPTQFSAEAVGQYENPYTQDVINSTMANINQNNAEQQQSLTGNAIARGAWGGDRADLAKNDLARQQALASNQTIAGLENQNYQQALGQFNTANQTGLQSAGLNSQTALQGAGLQGAMGNYASQLGLAGANAQFGMGQAQQATQNAQDAAAQNEFMRQQSYPFQTANFLSQIYGQNAGSQGMTNTQVAPNPNYQTGFQSVMGTLGAVAPFALAPFTGGASLAMAGAGSGMGGASSSPFNFSMPTFGGKSAGSYFSDGGGVGEDSNTPTFTKAPKLPLSYLIDDPTMGTNLMSAMGSGYGGLLSGLGQPIAKMAGGGAAPQSDPMQDFLNTTAQYQAQNGVSPAQRQDLTSNTLGDTSGLLNADNMIPMAGFKDPIAAQQPPVFGQSFSPTTVEQATQQNADSTKGIASGEPKALEDLQKQLAVNAPQLNLGNAMTAGVASAMHHPNGQISNSEFIANALNAGRENYAGQQKDVREYALKQAEIQKQVEQMALEAARYNKTAELQDAQIQAIKGGKGTNPETLAHNEYIKSHPMATDEEAWAAAAKSTAKVSGAGTGLADIAQDPEIKKLRGQDFYNAVKEKSPDYADRVYRLAKGYDQWPTPQQINKNPELAKETADAAKFDPNSNPKRWVNAAKWEDSTSFTGKKLIAGNTAVSHMGMLMDAINAQNNGNIPALNIIRNKWLNETGSELPTNLDIDKAITLDEVAKFVIPGVGAQADREQFVNTMKDSGSPAQLKGGLKEYYGLMRGQMKSMRHAYETDTGREDFDKFLDPDVKEKIGGGKSAAKEKSGTVRVKDANGKTGTIPTSQLEEAIKSGYTKVQ